MCRLFALHAGTHRVQADFWLLDAPDSLLDQSVRNPDGAGIGSFDEHGVPRVDKRPIAAWEDHLFAAEARTVRSSTFLAHVRHASTGALRFNNTHPFEQRGRLFAHNGVVEGLDVLDDELGDVSGLVLGDTDSERVFALITRSIDAHGGDIADGTASALEWIWHNLPVFALNILLVTRDHIIAFRGPDTHELHVLARPAGGATELSDPLSVRGERGRMRVGCASAAELPVVVVASERLDASPGWRGMVPGELVVVDPTLRVHSRILLPGAPPLLLTEQDLDDDVLDSQRQ